MRITPGLAYEDALDHFQIYSISKTSVFSLLLVSNSRSDNENYTLTGTGALSSASLRRSSA